MTPAEAESLLEDPSTFTFRSLEITPGAVPPDVVFASTLERFRSGELWFWCAPRFFFLSSEDRIIGSGCFKNSPLDGAVEIGCGVAESHRRRNFATEGVKLLVAEGFSKPEVTVITAETAISNTASQRVLEKAAFSRSGSRFDPEDGRVFTWRRERAAGSHRRKR
jgi:RimJ/RimL family protein N-acetyltransferase